MALSGSSRHRKHGDWHLRLRGTTAAALAVTAPPDSNVLPPGFYMVFIVNSGRVSSEARWIRIH